MKPARESVSNAADPATEQQPCLIITEDDIHLFSCGTWNRSWEKMGAHPDVQDGIAGWRSAYGRPRLRASASSATSTDGTPAPHPWSPCSPARYGRRSCPAWNRARSTSTQSRPRTARSSTRRTPMRSGPRSHRAPRHASWTSTVIPGRTPAWLADRSQTPHMERPLNVSKFTLKALEAPRGRAPGRAP